MKAKFLFAAVFACAVFTAEAFDNYAQAFKAATQARSAKKLDEALKNLDEAKSLAQNLGQKIQALNIASDICCWQKNDLKGALAKLDEIISLEGITPYQKTITMTKKANFLKWRGKRADAEKVYKEAMGLGTAGAAKQDLLNSYADLLRMNRKFDEAMKLYQESLAVEKGSFNYLNVAKLGIASVTADKKNYDKALELYNEVLTTPKVAAWIAESARRQVIDKVYFPQKKFAEIAEALDKLEADESIPKNQKKWIADYRIRLNVTQAHALMQAKKFDEAAEKLKAANTFQTQSAWLKQWRIDSAATLENVRGHGLRREKKYDEAIEAYKKVLDLKGASPNSKHNAYMNIATVLMNDQKKIDEAKEYIDKAMKLPKQNPNMQVNGLHSLTSYYLAKQNVDEALAALEKAAAVPGKIDAGLKAYTYSRLADIYFGRKKDLAKADEYIKKSMAVPGAKWGKNKNLEKRIKDALAKQNQ